MKKFSVITPKYLIRKRLDSSLSGRKAGREIVGVMKSTH